MALLLVPLMSWSPEVQLPGLLLRVVPMAGFALETSSSSSGEPVIFRRLASSSCLRYLRSACKSMEAMALLLLPLISGCLEVQLPGLLLRVVPMAGFALETLSFSSSEPVIFRRLASSSCLRYLRSACKSMEAMALLLLPLMSGCLEVQLPGLLLRVVPMAGFALETLSFSSGEPVIFRRLASSSCLRYLRSACKSMEAMALLLLPLMSGCLEVQLPGLLLRVVPMAGFALETLSFSSSEPVIFRRLASSSCLRCLRSACKSMEAMALLLLPLMSGCLEVQLPGLLLRVVPMAGFALETLSFSSSEPVIFRRLASSSCLRCLRSACKSMEAMALLLLPLMSGCLEVQLPGLLLRVVPMADYFL
ncbi:uncharacterized protein LOC127530410 [Acanthochromis polyacanthus]|uniref:uncharacterized protein LOC127530410 n=1 Tax=Acanthochromis polyacanthus TaxID=80966 RepID=UPI00223486E5|nr:uncharacterized protein LOC127530410 [Acanthochromis polyacanthus]